MRDICIEIEDAQSSSGVHQPPTVSRVRRPLLVSVLASALIIAAVFIVGILRSAGPLTEVRLDIATPPTTDPVSLAISPDGLKVVFVSMSEGRPALWLRSLDNPASAHPLKNTEGATFPFWSPDSRSVGFFAPGKVKRIDLDGAIVKELASAPGGVGGAWNQSGTILVGGPAIYRLPETGGEPVQLTRLAARQVSHKFPQFLSDGAHFLFYVSGAAETRGVYVGNTDGSEPRRLLDADAAAAYGSGQVFFVRQQTLFVQAFNAKSLVLSGLPSVVAEPITVSEFYNLAALSASAAGPFVYRGGTASGDLRQFQWVDSNGTVTGNVGDADTKSAGNPAMSPDFLHVAVGRKVDGNQDIWLLNLENGRLQRLTTDAAIDAQPLFSPDGAHLLFGSNRKGVFNFYWRTASGAGSDQILFETPLAKAPLDWSRDGILLYRVVDRRGGYDLFALPLDASGKAGSPFPVVQTEADERDGQFSPDGKWIAYQSDESKQVEIYIQQFPTGIRVGPVSVDGGAQARWRNDGRELFYIALDGRLMAVPLQFAADGKNVQAGAPRPLFMTHIGGALQSNNRQQYMVSKDGRHFLMNTLEERAVSPITIVLNRPR
jgi:Tol biopolymer transport system component